MTPKRRKLLYTLATLLERPLPPPAREPVDIVIPAVPKDLGVLPLCVEGVRHGLAHPLGAIYVVAPPDAGITAFCRRAGLTFVDERSVLGYAPGDIAFRPGGTDRSGWIFQQLLKLSGAVGTCAHYLAIDADHVLLRPHTFLTADGRTVFYGSRECHAPYYEAVARLAGGTSAARLSYVGHKMLFSRSALRGLQARIEARCGERWDRAILSALPPDELSGFSEYELYGLTFPAGEKLVRPWRNKSLRYDALADYATLWRRWGRRYRAVTFPEWMNR